MGGKTSGRKDEWAEKWSKYRPRGRKDECGRSPAYNFDLLARFILAGGVSTTHPRGYSSRKKNATCLHSVPGVRTFVHRRRAPTS